jgi:hypothetical protein
MIESQEHLEKQLKKVKKNAKKDGWNQEKYRVWKIDCLRDDDKYQMDILKRRLNVTRAEDKRNKGLSK